MSKKVNVLIDADSIIFASAVTSETFFDAKDKMDYKINEILDLMASLYEIEGFSVFSGSKGNFRKYITDDYKANRRDQEIPEHLNALHSHSKEYWNAKYTYGVETDDLLASYWQKLTNEGKNVIIVAIDKDYKQFPSAIYNYQRKEWSKISELDALKNFYTQMIVGDSADNIKVCKGKGKTFANKLLEPLNSKYQIVKAVYGIYREIYKSKAKLKYIETYNLLKLRTDVLR
jgi:5'-3' exonuclease